MVGGSICADFGPAQTSKHDLEDEVQYFPPGPNFSLAATSKNRDAVLGDLLFADVVSVHFIGPGHPANPDGSLGVLVAGDDGIQMSIYERYIVMESPAAAGTMFRTLHAYETLGRVEQRLQDSR